MIGIGLHEVGYLPSQIVLSVDEEFINNSLSHNIQLLSVSSCHCVVHCNLLSAKVLN